FWEIDASKHKLDAVVHTLGWPLDHKTYEGSFLYHMQDKQVSIGLMCSLNYQNPYLVLMKNFRNLKTILLSSLFLKMGRFSSIYGARTLNEGGFQDCLTGEFVRVGSNPKFAPVVGYHWFDGDGMIHGLHIKDRKATYLSRYVKTSRLEQEEYFGGPKFMKLFIQEESPIYTLKHGKPDHEAPHMEEKRERATICEAKAKRKMTKYYNARVRNVTFRPEDFVYRSNDASHAMARGKLGQKWEGPYEVTEALGDGAYKL
ncbi:reverse transcriptase domain-containing protein, partial [Tanacetum coccineum]